MSEGLLIDLPLPEVASRLAARYGPELKPAWVTAYDAASVVGAALGTGTAEVTTVEALAALLLVPGAREELDRLEAALIEAVLDRGVTWEQLGAVYGGRTRQTMQQHYRRRGGTRTWSPGRFPALAAVGDDAEDVVSRTVAEVAGSWRVILRRGCRPGDAVLDEVLPVILRLEQLGSHLIHRPWPEWFARDRTMPRRVRSAVHSFERIAESGSTVVLCASTAVSLA